MRQARANNRAADAAEVRRGTGSAADGAGTDGQERGYARRHSQETPRSFVTLRLDGKKVEPLKAGRYNFAVTDKSTKDNFHLQGPGARPGDAVGWRQTITWTVTLKKGVYRYSSDGSSKRKGSFTVS